MSIFTEQQAREILEKAVKLSKADECVANLGGGSTGNIRFALNQVSTSGLVDNANLVVTVAFGKKTGTATTNAFDDEAIARVVKAAEDLAKLSPENPEFMPAIGKQEYKPTNTYVEATAAVGVAGTIVTAATMALGESTSVHRHRLGADAVRGVLDTAASLPLAERAALPGLRRERAPVIVAGLVVLAEILTRYGLHEIEVSERDLLHGVALAAAELPVPEEGPVPPGAYTCC